MKINTEQNRCYLFVLITIFSLYGYQLYYNNINNKLIDEALEINNRKTVRYVEIINEQRAAIQHWKAMYHGSQTSNHQLEQQIDVISDYWKKQFLKVSDELFDVKHGK